MRRLALLGLSSFGLSGCAFTQWYHPPYFPSPDRYEPAGTAENLQRAQGQTPVVVPLSQESGNVWPGPVQPAPSLETLVKQEQSGELPPTETLPGQPPAPALPEPQSGPAPGASLQPVVPYAPPPPKGSEPGVLPRVPPPTAGQVIQTPQGPAVTSGGTEAFKSVTLPNGMTGIVVPNGNGTSTVIYSNGQVSTVPTPK